MCTPVSPESQPECAAGWALGLGAPVDVEEAPNSNFDRGTSIAVDDEGNIYLVGTYNQQVDFGGGISTAGADDPFVASFASDGSYRWHTQFGGTGHDTGGGVAVVPGTNEIVVVGAVTGDPGLPGDWPDSGLRGFVARFDRTTGAVTASRVPGATEHSRANSVVADATGVFVTGGFSGTFEVGIPRVSVGDEDMFAVRLDAALEPTWNWADGDTGKDLGRADGTPAWTRGYGGLSNDNGNALALALDGTVYVGGHFRETATFETEAMVAAEGADIFLMRLSP